VLLSRTRSRTIGRERDLRHPPLSTSAVLVARRPRMPGFAEKSVGRGAYDETGFCVPRAGVDPTITLFWTSDLCSELCPHARHFPSREGHRAPPPVPVRSNGRPAHPPPGRGRAGPSPAPAVPFSRSSRSVGSSRAPAGGGTHASARPRCSGRPPGGPRSKRYPRPTSRPPLPRLPDGPRPQRRSPTLRFPSPRTSIRPRSRPFAAGAEALSPAKLLAVILPAFPGTSEARALEVSGRLLA